MAGQKKDTIQNSTLTSRIWVPPQIRYFRGPHGHMKKLCTPILDPPPSSTALEVREKPPFRHILCFFRISSRSGEGGGPKVVCRRILPYFWPFGAFLTYFVYCGAFWVKTGHFRPTYNAQSNEQAWPPWPQYASDTPPWCHMLTLCRLADTNMHSVAWTGYLVGSGYPQLRIWLHPIIRPVFTQNAPKCTK